MEFPEYRQAVIHLSWFRDDQVRHLLFGMVELRPNELPDTVSCPRKDFRAKNKSRKYLHYQRFALSVPDSIDWYQKMIDGNLILPEDNEKLKDITFVQEPPWPHFVTSNELVFAPDWMHGSRTHFLFSKNVLSPEVSEIIRINKNRTKLEEWLNFDIIEAYSDYLGAICLVAPNPLFRSIEKSHFKAAREGADEDRLRATMTSNGSTARQVTQWNMYDRKSATLATQFSSLILILEVENCLLLVMQFPGPV